MPGARCQAISTRRPLCAFTRLFYKARYTLPSLPFDYGFLSRGRMPATHGAAVVSASLNGSKASQRGPVTHVRLMAFDTA
jgi:hypothetical protein